MLCKGQIFKLAHRKLRDKFHEKHVRINRITMAIQFLNNVKQIE